MLLPSAGLNIEKASEMRFEVMETGIKMIDLLFPLIKVSKKINGHRIAKKEALFSISILLITPLLAFLGIYYALYESFCISG